LFATFSDFSRHGPAEGAADLQEDLVGDVVIRGDEQLDEDLRKGTRLVNVDQREVRYVDSAEALWMAPDTERFCSRQAWGKQVAYASQFADPDNRAHRGQAKIKSRLIADLDPDEWDLPPKPKWMRWRTYNRYVQKFDKYEDILSHNIAELMALLDES